MMVMSSNNNFGSESSGILAVSSTGAAHLAIPPIDGYKAKKFEQETASVYHKDKEENDSSLHNEDYQPGLT